MAVVAPEATVAEAGTVSDALLPEMETAVAAAAALLKVTVQVLAAPEFRLVGEQTKEDSTVGATRFSEALTDAPFKVAVTVTV